MTAYRQRALACAGALAQGPRRPRDLKASIADAYNILHRNVYGWFVAVERGVYNLTETGQRALLRWPQMISPRDLHCPVIDASRPTTASRSTRVNLAKAVKRQKIAPIRETWSKDDVRVYKPITLNEPVAKIARALKRTTERRVKRLNVTDLSLKLWPQKPASPKNGLGRASRGAADF